VASSSNPPVNEAMNSAFSSTPSTRIAAPRAGSSETITWRLVTGCTAERPSARARSPATIGKYTLRGIALTSMTTSVYGSRKTAGSTSALGRHAAALGRDALQRARLDLAAACEQPG